MKGAQWKRKAEDIASHLLFPRPNADQVSIIGDHNPPPLTTKGSRSPPLGAKVSLAKVVVPVEESILSSPRLNQPTDEYSNQCSQPLPCEQSGAVIAMAIVPIIFVVILVLVWKLPKKQKEHFRDDIKRNIDSGIKEEDTVPQLLPTSPERQIEPADHKSNDHHQELWLEEKEELINRMDGLQHQLAEKESKIEKKLKEPGDLHR